MPESKEQNTPNTITTNDNTPGINPRPNFGSVCGRNSSKRPETTTPTMPTAIMPNEMNNGFQCERRELGNGLPEPKVRMAFLNRQ
jgi:hypothetical protein